jgi:hypothetical protein
MKPCHFSVMGNPYRIAMALNYSGDLARFEQNYTAAQTAYEESISLLRKLDARATWHLLCRTWDTPAYTWVSYFTHALFRESMAIQLAQQNTPGIAECLIGFAALAAISGLPPLERAFFRRSYDRRATR